MMAPEKKDAARRLVRRAIYYGFLVRSETCEQCGIEAKVQGHHTDYARPLDVQWLCVSCHRSAHSNMPLDDEMEHALQEVSEITARIRRNRSLRNAIIREALTQPDIRHGDMSKMAEAAGVTRGRVSQIVKQARANGDG